MNSNNHSSPSDILYEGGVTNEQIEGLLNFHPDLVLTYMQAPPFRGGGVSKGLIGEIAVRILADRKRTAG